MLVESYMDFIKGKWILLGGLVEDYYAEKYEKCIEIMNSYKKMNSKDRKNNAYNFAKWTIDLADYIFNIVDEFHEKQIDEENEYHKAITVKKHAIIDACHTYIAGYEELTQIIEKES